MRRVLVYMGRHYRECTESQSIGAETVYRAYGVPIYLGACYASDLAECPAIERQIDRPA